MARPLIDPPLAVERYPFAHPIRVRFAETDAMGVVHHASYIPWLEETRVALLAHGGHDYATVHSGGLDLAVVDVVARYRRSVRFGDYVNSIPLPAMIAVFKAEEWDNFGLVTVESTLTYAVLDTMLGGRRGGPQIRHDGRPFTTIEMNLLKRMVGVVLTDAETAFRPLSAVTFKVDRIETNPRFAMISRPANAAIRVDLRLEMEGRGGALQVLMPYATIEPVRELLLESFMGEKIGRDPIWENHLATEIYQATVPVEAVLHQEMMPLSRIMSLDIGDTLIFDAKPDRFVTLRCGDFGVTEGRVGRVDDKIAVQTVAALRRSRTTIGVFDASVSSRSERN